jgi:hypothetical protein
MLSFNDFQALNEIKATNRVGIQHLDKLTPTKFLELMYVFYKEFGGVLPKSKVKVTEKVDGSSIRFGVDGKNNFFIESSYSGPIYDEGDYTNYVISRGYEANEISQNFENLLKLLKSHKALNEVLQKHNKGEGVKVIGEMMYNPMAKVNGNKIRYVYMDYDKSKLANVLTVVPFSVEPEDIDKKALIQDLMAISTKDIRFDKIHQIDTSNIDLSFEVKNIETLLKNFDQTLAALKSRKKADKEEKEILKGIIQSSQAEVREKILSYIKNGTYGEEFEGVVLEIIGTAALKVTSNTFRKRMAQAKQSKKDKK